MKIYHAILSGNWGGSERYMSNLANLQVSKGHDVTLIVKSSKRKAHLEFFKNNHGAKIIVVPAEIRKNFSYLRRLYISLFIKPSKDIVFHCHDHQTILLLRPLAQKYKAPLICNLHTHYDPKSNGLCDAVIYGNQSRANEIIDIEHKSFFIPNFIMPTSDKEHYQIERDAILKAHSISLDAFNICTLSRLSSVKDIDVIIEAFKLFKKSRPFLNTCLIIAGAGEDFDRLSNAAKQNSDIHFTGQVTHPESIFSLSNCYAMASPRETGIPLSTLEAAAFGLPLALSACETHRYFFDLQGNKNDIHLFPAKDVKKLSEIFEVIYTRSKTPAAPQFHLGAFDPHSAFDKIHALYEDCRNSHRG